MTITIEKHWDGNESETTGANGRIYLSRGRWQWVVVVDGDARYAEDTRRAARWRVAQIERDAPPAARKNVHAVALGRRGGRADTPAQRAHRASAKAGAGRPRMRPQQLPLLHLAARETFAQDGLPACGLRRGFHSETADGFACTHTLAAVTCNSCCRTREFKRASALGLTQNDQTWNP